MLRVLDEHDIPVTSLRLLASGRSAGTVIPFRGTDHTVQALAEDTIPTGGVALFSAGGDISRAWAKAFAARGCTVIDNSSAFRMEPDVPLVVPGVNDADALLHKGIIAVPNCSTIQLVMALRPLHEAYGIRRVVVSTYQSVSGAGQKGVDHLAAELAGTVPTSRISPHPLAFNTVFHTIAEQDGGSEEEVKMLRETRRIMHLPDLRMAVTCVRVPVTGGHAESVALETERPVTPGEARTLLSTTRDIVVVDDPVAHGYPTPLMAQHTDNVYVGRFRTDTSVENGLLFWVVADNLRVGAATNAVGIACILRDAGMA